MPLPETVSRGESVSRARVREHGARPTHIQLATIAGSPHGISLIISQPKAALWRAATAHRGGGWSILLLVRVVAAGRVMPPCEHTKASPCRLHRRRCALRSISPHARGLGACAALQHICARSALARRARRTTLGRLGARLPPPAAPAAPQRRRAAPAAPQPADSDSARGPALQRL